MKVWVMLSEHPDEGRVFEGVYATQAAADGELQRLYVKFGRGVPMWAFGYRVEEHEAKS